MEFTHKVEVLRVEKAPMFKHRSISTTGHDNPHQFLRKPQDKGEGLNVCSCSDLVSLKENNTEFSAPIHVLPCEILESIFAFLDIKKRIEIELVCKHWRKIGKTRAWICPKELTVRECDKDSFPCFFSCDSTPSVLCHTEIRDDIFMSLLSRCGLCLRQLTLEQSKSYYWNTEQIMRIISKCCPNLSGIKLANLPALVGRGGRNGQKLATLDCPKLKSLKLHLDEVSDKDVVDVIGRREGLECLEVNSGGGGTTITGECFCVIPKTLKVLRLYRCRHLQNFGLQHILDKCSSLQDLRLTHCLNIDQHMMNKLLCRYKNTLETLFLSGYCKDLNWCGIVCVLRNLEKLCLCGCQVSDEVCKCLAKNCLKLKVLNIAFTDVSDAGLVHLASAPSLVALDISRLSLRGFGLEILAKQKRLKQVKAVNVTNLLRTNETFIFLAEYCPNLNSLDLTGATEVSLKLVESICKFLNSGHLKGPFQLGISCTPLGDAILDSVEGEDGKPSLMPECVKMCKGFELEFTNMLPYVC